MKEDFINILKMSGKKKTSQFLYSLKNLAEYLDTMKNSR